MKKSSVYELVKGVKLDISHLDDEDFKREALKIFNEITIQLLSSPPEHVNEMKKRLKELGVSEFKLTVGYNPGYFSAIWGTATTNRKGKLLLQAMYKGDEFGFRIIDTKEKKPLFCTYSECFSVLLPCFCYEQRENCDPYPLRL